ncbi:MAG: DUF4031 domain-containing protein [Acidimicrobiales bacterium]|nr:DUF4031 domain-containing protein [Acidimicrobiales bacterium]
MILVDTPSWPWRGRLWGHMVSDTSLAELHSFAQGIGKRRIGFQGDHYDINVEEHALAVEAGAISIDSRELVRRLRESGLRQRSKQELWTPVYQSNTVHSFATLHEVISATVTVADHQRRLQMVLSSAGQRPDALSVLVVERPEEVAMVLEFLDQPDFDPTPIDLLVRGTKLDVDVVELIIGNL